MQSFGTAIWTRLYGMFFVVTFTAVTVPTLVLMALIPGQGRRRTLAKATAGLIFRLTGCSPNVTGLDNLPQDACVAVANHASYLDGIILTAVLPARFTFVIKREMTQVPFVHYLLQRIGSEFVERSDPGRGITDARRILQHADRQQSLAVFPEGTFRAEPGLRRFHHGAFVAARRGKLALIPIVINGSRHMLPAGRMLPRPGALEVTIMPPVTNPDRVRSTVELMNICRQSVLSGLREPDLTA